MENFAAGDLTIQANSQPNAGMMRLDWLGKSNARQPSAVLGPYFEQLRTMATSAKVGFEMHFEAMEHFNSSTITALIQLIQKLRRERVPLHLVYDAGLKWQRLSFDALRVFEQPDGLLRIVEAQAA